MPRESIDQKAIRYLAESRVTISRIDGTSIDATVLGTKTRPYVVTYRAESGWRCSCLAPGSRCAHTVAISTLVLVPEPVAMVTK